MDYIINPSWFYWLHVVEAFNVCLALLLILSGVCFVVALVIGLVNYADGVRYRGDDPDWQTYLKAKSIALKIILPVFAASIIAVTFFPDKQTLIGMQIAKFATYKNAEWTLDTIKAAVDYIVESIKSIR